MIQEKNIEQVITEITGFIRNTTEKAVIGMSGGADSTLVAILCIRALGADNVYPIYMPEEENKDSHNDLAVITAHYLGLRLEKYTINNILEEFYERLLIDKYHNRDNIITLIGNIKARIRMIMLYTRANELSLETDEKTIVVGTSNLDELTLGYFTKFGDGAADCLPVADLHKLEVYQLLDYFCEQGILKANMIDRVPSAGLYDGQTDEGDLGYTYKEIEDMLDSKIDMSSEIKRRISSNSHKTMMPLTPRLKTFWRQSYVK